MADLYFGGSIWPNVDIALRHINTLYKQETEALGLSVIEWYVLQALYEEDGQMAGSLAERVGRPSTAFTPTLDRIENLGLIERYPHPIDRRAVLIRLTTSGQALREQVQDSFQRIEDNLRQQISEDDWPRFTRVLANLQTYHL